MPIKKQWIKAGVIALMVTAILCLHYFTFPGMRYHHAVYRMLFYLPLVLGSLWFGMKGALSVCLSVSVLFLPYATMQWRGFTFEYFSMLLEGVLYIIIAIIVGALVERERKKHKALLRAEMLSAVGKAVSEIAHDMKTPLMAIGGFATQVSGKLSQDDPNQKKLGIVIEETTRLESMVREMLDFARPLEIRPAKTSLNELVLEAVEVSEPMAKGNGVTLRVDPAPSLPSLHLDAPRIKQALLNLLANAVQASSDGEDVVVRTRLAGKSVVLEVIDSGSGIAEEHSENIFHAFFSTKMEGSGLGLGIVKRIVEAHGGVISFDSSPGKGTTFVVRLPAGQMGR
jgi:signal transduction histidine kinase